MRLLRWLVSARGVEDQNKQSWLIANMFTRVASLVGAAVSELIVAVTATCMHPTLPIVAWLCAVVLVLGMAVGHLGARTAQDGAG